MRNLLTHYRQVSLENTRTHATTYVNTPMRDAQDNNMFYYFLADLLTNDFRTTVLLYVDVYSVTNVPVASSLLKQIIILMRVDNPASTMHIREMLIESKRKLLVLKGNIAEFNQWVRKQMGLLHAREQEAVDLLYYLWKAYKAAPDDEFVVCRCVATQKVCDLVPGYASRTRLPSLGCLFREPNEVFERFKTCLFTDAITMGLVAKPDPLKGLMYFG